MTPGAGRRSPRARYGVQYQTVTTPSLASSEWEIEMRRSLPTVLAKLAAALNSLCQVVKVPRKVLKATLRSLIDSLP